MRRERKRVGARDRREPARRQVGHQRRLVNQLLVVEFFRANIVRVRIGRDDLTRDQAVVAKAVDRLVVPAFEKQVGIFDELAIDFLAGKGGKACSNEFSPPS